MTTSKLTALGFTGPYTTQADGSVNCRYGGHPYNIHRAETPDAWAALQADAASTLVHVSAYVAPPPPPPTPLPELIAAAKSKVRGMRVTVFATLAGIQSEALATGDTATATAIVGLQGMLRALPDIDLTACQSQADIDAAFVAGWLAIVAASPANVAAAFNGVLS